MVPIEFHELEIKVEAPKKVVVDKRYPIIYTIRNLGQSIFPGGKININMKWSAISDELVNNHPMEIRELATDDTDEFSFYQTDEVSGMTYLLRPRRPPLDHYYAKDGKRITLFLPDGNEVPPGRVIHSTRVKSLEEVSQIRANWISAGSLIVLIIIELIKWWLGRVG